MAKKTETVKNQGKSNAYIEGAGIIAEQKITETLKENFMPYAVSVIVSRALPEIDGFKPSQRKLLYTMYKMDLLNGSRTKSANVVGQTMRLNPHGEGAIYETMVRMSRGNESLLHPYVDSKGSFGKAYSRDMAYAASRYTEVKLDNICNELFRDIDKDTVDFVPNYDNTVSEPLLLPTTYPSILVNSNIGIAVAMASNICPFNLKEICETVINLIKNPDFDISESIKGPDFPGGGFILTDKNEIVKILNTGRGSVKIRSRYIYDKSANCIEITQIPPSTTVEAIIDKIIDLVKQSKLKEISDIRDETDLSGLRITIELKRGTEPDKLMKRLFKSTTLEDSYPCNFNVLIAGTPRVMGVNEILKEWIAFRTECIKRRIYFDLNKKRAKLKLLKALGKILLDIDKAIRIVRETEEEDDVIANLMVGFGIDREEAEYVAEIKLRHLNREYIFKRTTEIDEIVRQIKEMEDILASKNKIHLIIISELKDVMKKYGQERKTLFIYPDEDEDEENIEEIPDYPVNMFITAHGYLKKIIPQSLRMNSEQKLKDDDKITMHMELTNNTDLLCFTNKAQVYKSNLSEFDDTKASLLGEYVPAKLEFDDEEKLIFIIATKDYSENLILFFKNGKAAKVPLTSFQTKTRRKKLANAYSDKSELVAIFSEKADSEYLLSSSSGRKLLFDSAMLNPKTSRDTQGIAVMTQNKGCVMNKVTVYKEGLLDNDYRFRTRTIPAKGILLKQEDLAEQLSL